MSDRLFEIMSSAIPRAKTEWVDTGLTTESLRAAVEQVRSDTSYAPSCGTPERPHVFHPQEFERLIPYAEWQQSNFNAVAWASCANCGMPWPMGKSLDEQIDDLVDAWHEGNYPDDELYLMTSDPTLEDIIRRHTGWSHRQYNAWVTGGVGAARRAGGA